jgi:predicted O-methyltransferase YrrM
MRRSSLPGVEVNAAAQHRMLEEFTVRYRSEYDAFPENPTGVPHEYHRRNLTFGSVDAEILHCMVRRHAPRRVIEIGAGMSTLITAAALRRNAAANPGAAPLFTVVEPHPRTPAPDTVPGVTRFLRMRVQDVPIEEFLALEENDILFIDSTHELRIGSDVHLEYLEIVPRLRPGVIVHAHDILLPAEIHRDWFRADWRYLFWTEQYLLQAFLAFNREFEVLWAGSYMHLNHPELLESAFSSYRRAHAWPGSFWFRRVTG